MAKEINFNIKVMTTKTKDGLITKAKVVRLIKYYNDGRLKYEKEEAFEVCIELRDCLKKMGDYILGYNTIEEISEMLYDLIVTDGDIFNVEVIYKNLIPQYVALFYLKGTKDYYLFEINQEEYSKLYILFNSK